MLVYFNGNIVSHEEVKVSPFDRAFLFADGVYEALRTYNAKIFRLADHIKRLKYSLKETDLAFDDFDLIENISSKLAEMNNLETEYSVYIQISRGISFPRSHSYEETISPNVFAFVKPIKDNNKEKYEGVKVILEKDLRWLRCDIKSTSLLPSVMANQKAFKSAAYEAILYRDDIITEGSHTNFFAIKDNNVFTAPLSNYILDGVTRKVVLELCRENKICIIEKHIKVKELKTFDEFFVTGTTTEITPIIQFDEWRVKDGKPGEITRKIQEWFFKATN